jgi:DNA polymerase III delta subunit
MPRRRWSRPSGGTCGGSTARSTAYLGERTDVTAEDVALVVSAGAVASVFDYLAAVGARDTSTALRLLRSQLDGGESALGVHAMTVRHVRALIGARALMDRRVRIEEMAPQLGMPPWQVRSAVEQARNFEPAELTRALRKAAEAEAKMKSSPAEAGLELERWVVEVTRRS